MNSIHLAAMLYFVYCREYFKPCKIRCVKQKLHCEIIDCSDCLIILSAAKMKDG